MTLNWKVVWKICGFLFVTYLIWFTKSLKFSDEAYFGGDSGGYQIMAVNFAKGHDLMISGGIAGNYFEDYHLSRDFGDAGEEGYRWFIESGKKPGFYNFYRTPGYIVFLGLIYRFLGVSPALAKYVQLVLILVVAAGLPLVGFNYWKRQGVVAGVLAGLVFAYFYARTGPVAGGISYPSDILSEPLITFATFLIAIVFMFWEKKKSVWRALVLGVIVGIGLLIKGSLMFIPVLIFGYMGWQVVKKQFAWLVIAGFAIGVMLPIWPWSVYASLRAGQTVILSTQGDEVILEGNNEFSADGGWHPEGYTESKAQTFYGRPHIKNLPVVLKVAAFYRENPDLIVKYVAAKIRYGWEVFFFFKASVVLLTYELGLLLVKGSKDLRNLWRVGGWYGVFQTFQAGPGLLPVIGNYYYVNVQLVSLIGVATAALIRTKSRISIDMPPIFVILTLNFLLLTVGLFGYPRFIQVIDWVFILVGIRYGMLILRV